MKLKLYIILIILLSTAIPAQLVFSQPSQPLLQKWEFIAKKLEWAKEIKASFQDQLGIDLLNTAEIDLKHARRQIEVGHRLMAWRSINQADRSINQALMTLLRDPIKQRRKQLEDRIQEVKEALVITPIPEAKDLLDAGIEHKNLAEQAFQELDFQKSLKHFRLAEFLIQKVLDLVKNQDQSIQQQADDEASRFRKLLAQSQNMLSTNSDPTVQKNYTSLIELSHQAEQSTSTGNFRAAIDFYHQATRLLLRTPDLAEGKTDRSAARAYEEVTALNELIVDIQQKVKPLEDDERVQFSMSRIQQFQKDAYQALETNDYKLTLLNTRLARDLIERIKPNERG